MNAMDRARARAAIQGSERVMPLAMALIEAAAKQGANILELQDACSLVIAMFRDVLQHTSAFSAEFESKAKAAIESV